MVYGRERTRSSAFRHEGRVRSRVPEKVVDVNVPAAGYRAQRLLGLAGIGEAGGDGLCHELADVRRVALAVIQNPGQRSSSLRRGTRDGALRRHLPRPIRNGAAARIQCYLLLIGFGKCSMSSHANDARPYPVAAARRSRLAVGLPGLARRPRLARVASDHHLRGGGWRRNSTDQRGRRSGDLVPDRCTAMIHRRNVVHPRTRMCQE